MAECYTKLKSKSKNRNIISEMDYFCFHSPFYKMVQKAFTKLAKLEGNPSDEQIAALFKEKVHPTLHIPQRIGNIYTGSLFAGLVSLLVTNPDIKGKNVMLFSYGSGLCSTMMTVRVHQNPLTKKQGEDILARHNNRVKVSPKDYT